MSGTHVFYNGVLFRDCEIREWDQVIETDESGTSEKYSKLRVTIYSTLVSIFNPGSPSTPGLPIQAQHPSTIRMPPISGETMVDRMEEIQIRLQEYRKDFWLAFNACTGDPVPISEPYPREDPSQAFSYRTALVATGIEPKSEDINDVKISGPDGVLDINRADVFDCNHGPKPQGVKVSQVFGGYSVGVVASFEICRVLAKPADDSEDPGYDAQKAKGLISNKWSVTDSLDADGKTTHHIRGKATVKDARYKANAMRLFCFPLAFPYAKLSSRSYAVDETGLVLEYDFQYTHAGSAPPFGIRDYEATYFEAVNGTTHGTKIGGMNIRVKGWFHRQLDGAAFTGDEERSQKQVLLRGMYTILHSRIRGISKLWQAIPGVVAEGEAAPKVRLTNGRITEKVGVPVMEMDVQVEYTEDNIAEFHMRLINMGKAIEIPNYDPRWWPIDGEFGRDVSWDKDNPYFRAPALPYSEEGDPEKSDYFTGYFSPVGSTRHTTPRLAARTVNEDDESKGAEWARPGGYVPLDAVQPSILSTPTSIDTPISTEENYPEFSAIVSRDLQGSLVLGTLNTRESESYGGVSQEQRSGFMYLAWDSEVLHDSDEGVIHVPLSASREMKEQTISGGVNPITTEKIWRESSVALRIFPGISKRVYSVTATRLGKWPEVPEPVAKIVREQPLSPGSTSGPVLRLTENLLKKEVISETPKLAQDGFNRIFTVHCRWTYSMSIPWNANSVQGGASGFAHSLPVGKSPIDKATQENNELALHSSTTSSRPSVLFDQTVEKYG